MHSWGGLTYAFKCRACKFFLFFFHMTCWVCLNNGTTCETGVWTKWKPQNKILTLPLILVKCHLLLKAYFQKAYLANAYFPEGYFPDTYFLRAYTQNKFSKSVVSKSVFSKSVSLRGVRYAKSLSIQYSIDIYILKIPLSISIFSRMYLPILILISIFPRMAMDIDIF